MTAEEFKRLSDALAAAGFKVVALDIEAFFARFDAGGPGHRTSEMRHRLPAA